MTKLKHIAAAVLLALATPVISVPANAAPRDGGYERQDRVPLNRIVARMERDLGGKFMRANFDEGANLYRIIWRMPNGNMVRFRADAGSGHYTRARGQGER